MIKITLGERNKLHHEIQSSIQRQKEAAIDDILRKADPEKKGDTLLAIKSIVDAHNKMSEQWDRFLHNGKTEAEEIRARFDSEKKESDKTKSQFDDLFGDLWGMKKGAAKNGNK